MLPLLLLILTKPVIKQLGWGGVKVSESGLASHPLFYITACLQES